MADEEGVQVRTAILWFRRDLRLRDNPALHAAAGAGDAVLPVFVLDPVLVASGGRRTARLAASLDALRAETDGSLVVRHGDPAVVVPELAGAVGAREVHVSGETTPYGRRRDARVRAALERAGRSLIGTGTPYAVDPGTVRTRSGTPYQVFTPFSRAWRRQGWDPPAPVPGGLRWVRLPDEPSGGAGAAGHDAAPAAQAGEAAAAARWQAFLADDLEQYAQERDRPDLAGTSRLSVHLKLGEIHPRTLLADLADHPAGRSEGAQRFVAELAWREFYADVLHHEPRSAWHDLGDGLAAMAYDAGSEVEALVDAWRAGRTGYPFVDAGMRQLLAEGWMHNRLRMVTASFLVKDLHVWWPVGARHFMDHLLDGDLASNSHGWQWVAGTGTDASPWFRIFNPVDQGRRFDPDGAYVRRWVPELEHLRGASAHQPWTRPDGYDGGYPRPVVDHAAERLEALARYDLARGGRP